ncbi:MAG: FAD-binding oxidoreductase [Thermoplasmataceae archaeon]
MAKVDGRDKFIIVGAGSTGTSIAYHLASAGKEVTVIEENAVAAGNTGKSSALVRTHYSNRIIAEMSLYSLKFFEDFNSIGYSGFTKTGMIFPFDEKYADVARDNVAMLRDIGINEQEIAPADIRKFYPDVNLDGYDYVTYEPESGYADPVSTANSFMSRAKEFGASLILKKSVRSVESTSSGPEVELSDGTKIRGKKIILATNVWTNDILSRSGISSQKLLPITASMHSIIYLRRPEEYRGPKPTLWDPHQLAYYKMEGSSITAVGSLDPAVDEQSVDIHSNLPETAEQDYIEEYLPRIAKRLPSMGKATLISTLNGLYDMSPDGQVICDELSSEGLDSVYVFAGLSGHGFKLSPAYGRMVADMLMEKQPEDCEFDWRPFGRERFRTGKLITSRYSEIGTIY